MNQEPIEEQIRNKKVEMADLFIEREYLRNRLSEIDGRLAMLNAELTALKKTDSPKAELKHL